MGALLIFLLFPQILYELWEKRKEDRICGNRGKFGAVQNRFGISRRTLKVKQSRKMLGNEDRMKISTKGRYAVRVMLDLALNNNGECIKVKEIAARQGISEKYLEQIIAVLNKAGYVKSVRGAQGGYRIAKDPADFTVGMILRLTEGSLAPVACLEEGADICERCDTCETLEVWQELYDAVNKVVDGVTIADLVERRNKRLENLEEISSSFEGVEQAFAVQAGREVRIMVKPDVISDDQVILLARSIAKKIEDTLDYPGQIKVNVIRESRAVEYAK